MDVEDGLAGPSARDGLHMFHRVTSLLTAEPPLTTPPDTTVPQALALMKERQVGHLPVLAGKEVLGLFSHQSFTTRLVATPWLLQRTKSADSLVVEDFIEPPVFVRATDAIDSILVHLESADAVLVGDPNRLDGIVTSSDVIGYLYRVAAPYLLLKETEVGLRALIAAAVTPEQLAECATTALTSLYQGREQQLPTSLETMTFDEQVMIVINSRNWPYFAPLMGTNRDLVSYEIRPIGKLRNDVFHFKRELEDEDVQRLAAARAWVHRKLRRKEGQTP